VLLIAVLVVVLGAPWAAAALEQGKSLMQFPHRVWQTAEGLPQNSTLSLAQTPDGYLWGGTWEGLVRFDGVRFTVFEKSNTPALPGRSVRCLALGLDGTLWIGMNEGVAGMRQGTFFSVAPPSATTLADPRELVPARDGSLWIATEGHGITRLQGGHFQTWTTREGLASDQVLALAEGPAGEIWAGGPGGLQRWDGSAWMPPLPFDGKPQVEVTTLVFDREGTLWAGTEDGDVYRLRDGLMRWVAEASLPGAPIAMLLVDRAGSLWVGSLGHGLLRLVGNERATLDPSHPLSEALVNRLLEDAEGNLWIGTEAFGLHRLKDAPFTTYGPPEGLAHDMVLAIRETRDGSLWFGTVGGGVTRWRDGQMKTFTMRDGLALDRVRSIAETPDGSVWFGTRGGVSRFRDGAFTTFGVAQGLPDLRGFLLDVDARGTLWVGTPKGLARWNGERFEPFSPRGGLPGEEIQLLRASAVGGLWVGTNNGGLIHVLDGQTTVVASNEGPLLHTRVLSLYEESPGTLWLGTNDGLLRWRNGQFQRISVANGLFDDRIFHILPDGQGNLWMSSNKGISRVAQAELEAVAEGRLTRVTPRVYGPEDGMRSSECNAHGSPGGWRDRGGRLWFPTIRGAVAYTAEQEYKPTRPPPVIIEELRVGERVIPATEHVRLPWEGGQLEFHYTSTGLRAPQQLRFRYQLEGIDTDWVQAGTRRVAYYTRLPPGRHRLLVEATYVEGGEVQRAELKFHLEPRFHQTWWFRLACVLAAMLAVAAAVWLRVRRLRLRELELAARVDQRTAELATVNANLSSRLQELQTTRERLFHAEKLAAVGTLAAGVGHELNNPLAFVVSNLHYVATEVRDVHVPPEERKRLEEVQQALREALQGTERMRRIIQDLRTFARTQPELPRSVNLHAVLELSLSIADGEIRHRARVVKDYGELPVVRGDETRLCQVFINLLVNAAQAIPEGHADQNEIRITLRKNEQGQAVVAVSDTGTGIPPEVLPRIFEPFFTTKPVGVGTGLGLSICHSFVQGMGGDIRVRSEQGRGTTFEVFLPAVPEDSQAEPPAEPPPVRITTAARRRLMVIDDEPLMIAALSRTLAPEYEVLSFTSARQALELLRRGDRSELILCDLMMPDMTGMELHATLAREAPELARRMVFLTGGPFTHAARAFLETTPLPCLEKPFEPENLRSRIRALLRERKSSAA
jgi:ligand-binding sensor domain-containing protein/signal transduction histidine kinase/CheY-like chemotaxis protein